MKRKIITVTAVTILLFVGVIFTGCGLRQRVTDLEIGLKNLGKLNEEVAKTATETQLKVEKLEKGFEGATAELNKLYSLTTKISDHLSFIPEEAVPKTTAAEALKAKKELTRPEVTKPPASAPAPPKAKVRTVKTTEEKLDELTKRVDSNEKRLDKHDSQLSKLLRRLAEAEDEIGKPVYLWTAEFLSRLPKRPGDKEELQLPDKLKPGLDDLAFAITHGKVELQKKVIGYADPAGNEKDNLELSKRRAQACINHLVTRLGPDKEVIWQSGTKWKDYFVAVGKGETSRYGKYKYNRRVRFQRL